jgi:hypothetical protein
MLDALERHGHLRPDGDVRVKLVAARAATIDRPLVIPRSGGPLRRRRRSGTTAAIRRSIPVRTNGCRAAHPQAGRVECERGGAGSWGLAALSLLASSPHRAARRRGSSCKGCGDRGAHPRSRRPPRQLRVRNASQRC